MGLLEGPQAVHAVSVRYCPWGQVIYDHNRRAALDRVNKFLDSFGVIRAGRYSQWGYMMTHDCVLRGKKVAEHLARPQRGTGRVRDRRLSRSVDRDGIDSRTLKTR